MSRLDQEARERASWQATFQQILEGTDSGVDAAVEAALRELAGGGSRDAARAAGLAAASRYRRARRAAPATEQPVAGRWPHELAGPLFTLPPRWGWQAAEAAPAQPPAPPPAAPRPVWSESPRPDTSALRSARASAVSKLGVRAAGTVVAVTAFVTFQDLIGDYVDQAADAAGLSESDTRQVFTVAVLVTVAVLAIRLIQAVTAVRYASANIRAFEQPAEVLRSAERERHQQALREWEAARRQQEAQARESAQAGRRHRDGPLWYPVRPVSEPARVDVFGGDPHRNGWASLLVTLGTSLLASGRRITVLDLTGADVGGGLAGVARARGLTTRRLVLAEDGAAVDLLAGIPGPGVAEALAYAAVGRPDSTDLRHERALAIDVLRRVISSLDGTVTFARLAAGIQVLRQGAEYDVLTDQEVSRLAAGVGDIDQNEWTGRQLRFLASQLAVLHALAPAIGYPVPLWTDDAVSLIATGGGRDDRKDLVDRLLIQLAQAAMEDGGRLSGVVVVAGADHLGGPALTVLSDRARRAGVHLVLMIDQPQGDLEKSLGTGGAVCIMKMYNHRDAAVAAEFVGKGHRFLINQVTRQTGKSFSDGGNDSFNSSTTAGRSTGAKRSANSQTESRAQAWTGGRNWTTSDSIGTSTSSSRVHEFIVDPQEILGMPETAFLLVDNSGHGRRVLMADANPGISLMERVSTHPAPTDHPG